MIDWWDTAQRVGLPLTMALFAVVGVIRRWWVPGWLYDSERRRADRLEDNLYRALGVSEKLADAARGVVDRGER